MSDKALFDAVRAIVGRGLTQGEVDRIKAAMPSILSTPSPTMGNPIEPNDALLIKELERDEGRVKHAYLDSLGFWTIGIGRLIDKRRGGGLSDEEIDYLKRNDIARFKRDLDQVAPWWRSADPVRQRAIQNLAFNLGADGLVRKWPNTVALMKAGRWKEAAAAIRANKVWVGQVGARAERIAKQIEAGGAA